jgi:hypothetical protein
MDRSVRALLLLLPALVAAPLAGQLRLPKPKLPTASGTTRAATRVPTYDDRVLEITDARVSALLRGLAAEQGKVQELQALERAAQDEAAAEAVEERRQRDERKPVDPAARERVRRCYEASPEYRTYMGAAEVAKREAAMQRATRASEQRKYDEMTRISDSLTSANNAWEAKMLPVARRCGATDEMLRDDDDDRPGRPEEMPPEAEEVSVQDSLMAVGAATSGMAPEAYGVMRERVLAFLNASPEELNQSSYIYSALELRALQGKRSQLSGYMELLTEY